MVYDIGTSEVGLEAAIFERKRYNSWVETCVIFAAKMYGTQLVYRNNKLFHFEIMVAERFDKFLKTAEG